MKKMDLKFLPAILVIFLMLVAILFFSGNRGTTNNNATDSSLYSKNLTIGTTTIRLVVNSIVESFKDSGDWHFAEYQFYSSGINSKLMTKVVSLIPPEYANGEDKHFFLKDITGNGIPEIFIMVEAGTDNREYEILLLENNSLVNITIEGAQDKWVGFDEITQENGKIYIKWHGNDQNGKTQYQLVGNKLFPLNGIVFKWNIETEDENDCMVIQTIPGDGQNIIDQKSDCSIWTDSFDKYFETKSSNVKKLPTQEKIRNNLLRQEVDDNVINLMLNMYWADSWEPVFLTKGDLNNDSKDDYVFFVQDSLHKYIKKDEEAGSRKLIVLLSSLETYQIAPPVPFGLSCIDCGGARWGSPQVDGHISTSTLSLSQMGGSAWTWADGAEFKYENNTWLKLKDYSDWFWINDYDGSREYYETIYVYSPIGNGQYSVSSTTKSIRGDKVDRYESGELP